MHDGLNSIGQEAKLRVTSIGFEPFRAFELRTVGRMKTCRTHDLSYSYSSSNVSSINPKISPRRHKAIDRSDSSDYIARIM